MNFAGLFKYFTEKNLEEKTLEEKRITEIETEIGYTITNISSNPNNGYILLGKYNLINFTAIYIYYCIISLLRKNKNELTKSKIDELFKKIKELEIPIIDKISFISYDEYIRNNDMTNLILCQIFKKIKELEPPIIDKISSVSYEDLIRNNDMNALILCEDMKKLIFQLDYYFKITKIFLYKEEL